METTFAQVFQNHIATQAKPYQTDMPVTARAQRMINHLTKVSSFANVIRTQQAVGLTTATPKIQAQGIPAPFIEVASHAPNVRAVGGAFQTVQPDNELVAARAGPVDIQKVAIGEL